MDFQGYWGWLVAYDAVPDDPLSFDVRLFGVNVARVYHYDLTGQRLRVDNRPDVSDYVTITATDLAYFRFILDENVIGYSYGPYKQEFGDLQTYSVVHLPLSKSGKTNDQLVVLAQILD